MFRKLLVLFAVGFGVPCFSTEVPRPYGETSFVETLALTYVRSGNAKLFGQEYELALQDFKHAAALLDHPENQMDIANYWVLLGKIVAYDNLGERNLCEQTVGRLAIFSVAIFSKLLEMEDEAQEAGEEETLPEELELMRKLAGLVRSPDIREMFMAVVKLAEAE